MILAILAAIAFGTYSGIRDIRTLDPLPDNVTREGNTWTIGPGVTDGAAEPDRLCARIGPGADDDPYGVDWVPSGVQTDADGSIRVQCEYGD